MDTACLIGKPPIRPYPYGRSGRMWWNITPLVTAIISKAAKLQAAAVSVFRVLVLVLLVLVLLLLLPPS
ncbi:unnamed protein product [Cutaneotrichosporon oleaginosum]